MPERPPWRPLPRYARRSSETSEPGRSSNPRYRRGDAGTSGQTRSRRAGVSGTRPNSDMSVRSARLAVNQAAGRATPLLLTAALSFAGAAGALPLPIGSEPVRMGLIVLALVVGIGLTVALDRPGSRPYWQMTLLVTLVLMPVVALQASASRVPFVAIARGSAGPLLWFTFATCIVLTGLWLFASFQSDQVPQNGALLFLPAAVLVPAILGAPGSLDETSALTMLGEACLVAGVSTFLALLSPASWRPLAGAAALGAQFVLLWALGRGPVIGQDGGTVVPACAALLLSLTALLTVLTPLGALFSRRFFQTVEEETGGPKPASAPKRGARRSESR